MVMGKVLVLYDSASGNTGKMAGLVAEGAGTIPGTDVRVRTVDEATADDVLWCDGLALGSPTNMGLLSWKMKRFWDGPMAPHWMKVDGKIGCAFSSSGGWGGGTELACQSLLTVLMNFGFLVFGVTDYASKLTRSPPASRARRAPRTPAGYWAGGWPSGSPSSVTAFRTSTPKTRRIRGWPRTDALTSAAGLHPWPRI